MEFLTETQVKKAAAKSDKVALNCSIKHWWQLSQAKAKELLSLDKRTDGAHFGKEYCAVCVRNVCGACISCPVFTHTHILECNKTPFRTACSAYNKWQDHRTVSNWYAWKRAAKAEYEFLKSLKPKP